VQDKSIFVKKTLKNTSYLYSSGSHTELG